MLEFNDVLKTQQGVDAVNKIATFLAPDDRLAIENISIDLVIHAGNAVIETAIAACRLAQQKQCPLLFSGGIGHSTQLLIDTVKSLYPNLNYDFNNLSEAEITGYLAVNVWGFPKDKLILETQSTNCGANAAFSLNCLNEFKSNPKDIAIFQDPTMQLRTLVTFQKTWLDADLTARFYGNPSFVPQLSIAGHQISYAQPKIMGLWRPGRFLSLLLGEIPRLRDDENGYGPKGKNFIPYVNIPWGIEKAYHHLQTVMIDKNISVLDRKNL